MGEAKIIDGKAFATKLRGRISSHVAKLKEEHNITPGLAVILVGEDPASQIYVRNKGEQTKECGMNSYEHRLPADTSADDLMALVDKLNNDPAVHGILCQLPLPKHLDEKSVINAIDPRKDVDGFHIENTGLLATGQDALVPCTPLGCLLLLRDELGDLTGKDALVIGRSNIVGKPMASLLLDEGCTVSVAHSRTKDTPGLCRRSDIVVVAVGVPQLVKGDWIKPGATVIDVGINRIPAPERGEGKTRIVGDVDTEAAAKNAAAITPVPGGVGPMTIACLLANTVTAACRQHGLEAPKDLSA